MIFDFLASPTGLGVAVGFIGGSFGYILVKFHLRPLLRYRTIKSRIAGALAGKIPTRKRKKAAPEPAQIYQECATALSGCYNDILPVWYKLALGNREESPLEAARHLMTLARTKDPKHAEDRIRKIKKELRLT
jgi:hypothetical protein